MTNLYKADACCLAVNLIFAALVPVVAAVTAHIASVICAAQLCNVGKKNASKNTRTCIQPGRGSEDGARGSPIKQSERHTRG